MKTKRLEILENSLIKKEAEFQSRLDSHFADVKSGNGQPMNDKRNGQATMNRWDKQNQALRNLKDGIEKTKNAIEKEQSKIAQVEGADVPTEIQSLIDAGKVVQWRKHPNFFFVVGVEKARLVWREDIKKVMHRYVDQIPHKTGQFEIFRDIFNQLNNTLNKKSS